MMTSASGITRVLVVDDEAPVRELARVTLEGAGFVVTTAVSGRQALSMLRTRAVAPPHVVVIDLDNPVMTGEAFVVEYRRLPAPHAPIVVLSGALNAGRRAAALGAAACLPKPFRPADLVALIRQVAAA